jgi:hypothetical protein
VAKGVCVFLSSFLMGKSKLHSGVLGRLNARFSPSTLAACVVREQGLLRLRPPTSLVVRGLGVGFGTMDSSISSRTGGGAGVAPPARAMEDNRLGGAGTGASQIAMLVRERSEAMDSAAAPPETVRKDEAGVRAWWRHPPE